MYFVYQITLIVLHRNKPNGTLTLSIGSDVLIIVQSMSRIFGIKPHSVSSQYR